VSTRTITPIKPWYGSTEWHPEPQWLLTAFDHEKHANRDFALKDFGYPAPSPRAQALEDISLPVVGYLFVARGGATARAMHGMENGPDENSPLVRLSDVSKALEPFRALASQPLADGRKFQLGDRVTKNKGSNWTGRVVGFYSTELTPEGYAVESETEKGSVQIYPEAALRPLPSAPSEEVAGS